MATVSDPHKQDKDDGGAWNEDDFPSEVDGSVEDKADAPDDKPEVPRIEGVNRQLSLLAGGEEPDSSTFKMRGGSVPVEGEFEKGATLKVLVTLSVDEIAFVDKKDKDGYVVGTERRHIAKPLSIQRL